MKRAFPPDWPLPAQDTARADETVISITESEIIEMAWCDDTSFDSIEDQTGLSEGDVIALMRRSLKPRSFQLWRKRVSGRPAKHASRVENQR